MSEFGWLRSGMQGTHRQVLIACVLGLSATALAAPSTAWASTPCSAPMISSGTATVTCPVGTDDTWTAPDGVTQATFDVQGAAGGQGRNAASAGGNGGHTTAALTVIPGAAYHIAVGSKGHNGTSSGGGSGGVPGGGSSGPGVGMSCPPTCTSTGGGGGGASVVATRWRRIGWKHLAARGLGRRPDRRRRYSGKHGSDRR